MFLFEKSEFFIFEREVKMRFLRGIASLSPSKIDGRELLKEGILKLNIDQIFPMVKKYLLFEFPMIIYTPQKNNNQKTIDFYKLKNNKFVKDTSLFLTPPLSSNGLPSRGFPESNEREVCSVIIVKYLSGGKKTNILRTEATLFEVLLFIEKSKFSKGRSVLPSEEKGNFLKEGG